MTNKDKFCKLLLDTKREGIVHTIEKLSELGFFEAPASTKYHGCYDGGLLDHSLNVYEQIMYLRKLEIAKFRPELEDKLKEDSCIIVSLLHDICKSNFYKKIKKWRKDSNDRWEQYDTYDQTYNYLPIGHGEKSVIMLLKWKLDLTDDEICAIRWHMGAFDISQYPDAQKAFNASCDSCPLASILISADWLASRITETKNDK